MLLVLFAMEKEGSYLNTENKLGLTLSFEQGNQKKLRALSLDALRGYAIITMVLSGQIFLKHMPAWMAHAQVPPNMGFTPEVAGITWVDLVFPFFLFSMGAAFPFSIGTKLSKNESRKTLILTVLVRTLQLVFFAIYFQHIIPWIINTPITIFSSLMSILGFILMFPMFMDIKIAFMKDSIFFIPYKCIIKIGAYVLAFLFLSFLTYENGSSSFDLYNSDIIIIILANMAFFGSIVYILTWNKSILLRLSLLPFVMAVLLAHQYGGWVQYIYQFSPFPWAYNFVYLKYLFIVIPGSIAGDYLKQWLFTSQQTEKSKKTQNKILGFAVIVLSLLLTISNLIFLFNRSLYVNILTTSALLILYYFVLERYRDDGFVKLWKSFFVFGSYFLMLGLFLEGCEGGIKKDPSTYSYYFVTSGLAFFAFIFFSAICDYFRCIKFTRFLVMSGQNPMIAYVATSLVVVPLLTLTNLSQYMHVFESTALLGFLRGALLTTVTILITMLFTRLKWFWRT